MAEEPMPLTSLIYEKRYAEAAAYLAERDLIADRERRPDWLAEMIRRTHVVILAEALRKPGPTDEYRVLEALVAEGHLQAAALDRPPHEN
ncbi:MAG: hypothetical protein K1Y01_11740 [Vicinamibacteria bacterium]|nr:hypothetical protein [Vicinamibacteria bacterium]